MSNISASNNKQYFKNRLQNYKHENFKKKNRVTSIIYYILTVLVIAVLIAQAIEGNYENCFTCALTLVLFLIPNFIESRLKITLPQTLEVIIILFIFAAEMLGEINAFYLKFPWWDTMLHTLNGFLMAAIGFSMVDILNKNDRFKFQLSPLYIAIVAFCFSMTIGVLWEFFEYYADLIFLTDMQKDTIISSISSVDINPDKINAAYTINGIENVIVEGKNLMLNGQPVPGGEYALNLGGYLDIGLMDTMDDMLVNFIGAVVFSVLGYFYIKKRGKGNFIKRFIPIINNANSEPDNKQE